jgi:hypothetical protein
MPKKRTKKEQAQKLAKEIGAALTDGPEAKPARKSAKAPKAKPAKAQPAGALSKREAERSLWAPRVEPKAAKKSK